LRTSMFFKPSFWSPSGVQDGRRGKIGVPAS